jgi:hypothetical protein
VREEKTMLMKKLGRTVAVVCLGFVTVAPAVAMKKKGNGGQKAWPHTILYSQDSISPTFSEGLHRGQSVQTLIDALVAARDQNAVRAMRIEPIVVCEYSNWGGSVTLDNRRLYAFRKANKRRALDSKKKQLQIPVVFGGPRCNELDGKLTSTTQGKKIHVEGQTGYDSEAESSGDEQVDDESSD